MLTYFLFVFIYMMIVFFLRPCSKTFTVSILVYIQGNFRSSKQILILSLFITVAYIRRSYYPRPLLPLCTLYK